MKTTTEQKSKLKEILDMISTDEERKTDITSTKLNALDKYKEFKKRMKVCPREKIEQLIDEVYKTLGDSLSRSLLVNNMMDKSTKGEQ